MSRQLVLPLWVTGLRKNDSIKDSINLLIALLQSRGLLKNWQPMQMSLPVLKICRNVNSES